MVYSLDPLKYIDRIKSYFNLHGLSCNLDEPKTIQEKLEWLNIYSPNKLKTKCADKILLHDYSVKTLGTDICIPLIKTYNKTSEIEWNDLPNQFVIKCNHGSGMNIIVKDKTSIDVKNVSNKLNRWLNTDFAFQNGVEIHYHDIERKILVEQYMDDGHSTLHDYKFWCFNGEPGLYTINDGNGHGDIMYYRMDDTEYNLYNVKANLNYKKPVNFSQMVEYARLLSKPFKFVRCDFYEINNIVYLGELTFTPGACVFKYKNKKDNYKVGEMLKI